MATPALTDEYVDALNPIATIGHPFLTTLGGPPDGPTIVDVPQALRAFCSLPSWTDAAMLVGAAADRSSASTDHQGFVMRPDGPVLVFDGLDSTVVVSEDAFLRLVGRLLSAVMDAAVASADAVVDTPVWIELMNSLSRL